MSVSMVRTTNINRVPSDRNLANLASDGSYASSLAQLAGDRGVGEAETSEEVRKIQRLAYLLRTSDLRTLLPEHPQRVVFSVTYRSV